jgi:uncharacterized protein (DUF305 family)
MAVLLFTPAARGSTSMQGQPVGPLREGADADGFYVTLMIAHTRLGLDIAAAAVARASREELRTFAARLIEDQTRDLEELRQLPGGSSAAAALTEAAHAETIDPDTEVMMARLRETAPRDFDALFITTIVAHHDMAVDLSKNPARFDSAPVRAFAQRIARRQARAVRELRLMQRGS